MGIGIWGCTVSLVTVMGMGMGMGMGSGPAVSVVVVMDRPGVVGALVGVEVVVDVPVG